MHISIISAANFWEKLRFYCRNSAFPRLEPSFRRRPGTKFGGGSSRGNTVKWMATTSRRRSAADRIHLLVFLRLEPPFRRRRCIKLWGGSNRGNIVGSLLFTEFLIKKKGFY